MAEQLTPDEEQALGTIARAVLLNPDLVDELAQSVGEDIATDPTEAAFQIIMAAAASPKEFDSIVNNFDATENNFVGTTAAVVASAVAGAGKKIAGLFKNKEKSGAVKDWLKGTFAKVGDKLKTWKENREVKKELKNSGDPNWKSVYKDLKDSGQLSLIKDGGGIEPPYEETEAKIPEGVTVGEFRTELQTKSGTTVPDETIIPAGMTATDVENALKTMDTMNRRQKIWMWVGLGSGIAFLASLVYIFMNVKPTAKKS